MTLVAALLEPAAGPYVSVRLEFRDQPVRRVIFGLLEQAMGFQEQAERLVQKRATWTACLAAAQAHAGFVRASEP
jgi:uncharacterized membrane-anchored protein